MEFHDRLIFDVTGARVPTSYIKKQNKVITSVVFYTRFFDFVFQKESYFFRNMKITMKRRRAGCGIAILYREKVRLSGNLITLVSDLDVPQYSRNARKEIPTSIPFSYFGKYEEKGHGTLFPQSRDSQLLFR